MNKNIQNKQSNSKQIVLNQQQSVKSCMKLFKTLQSFNTAFFPILKLTESRSFQKITFQFERLW